MLAAATAALEPAALAPMLAAAAAVLEPALSAQMLAAAAAALELDPWTARRGLKLRSLNSTASRSGTAIVVDVSAATWVPGELCSLRRGHCAKLEVWNM